MRFCFVNTFPTTSGGEIFIHTFYLITYHLALDEKRRSNGAISVISRNFAKNNRYILMEEKYNYPKEILEFVALCADYCRCLEQCQQASREAFVDSMLAALPALYAKIRQLQSVQQGGEGYNEPHVTESDYEFIRASVAMVMKEHDDYLDVFVEDFKYSDQPILQTISENLADLYQVLRDFLEIFRSGYDDAIDVALSDVIEDFRYNSGQKILNALRALHDSKYGGRSDV